MRQKCVCCQSFFDTVPRERLRELRYRVAWHQYHMMHATTLLRQSLPIPPAQTAFARMLAAAARRYGTPNSVAELSP